MNSMTCRKPGFVCKLNFINKLNVVDPVGILMQMLTNS